MAAQYYITKVFGRYMVLISAGIEALVASKQTLKHAVTFRFILHMHPLHIRNTIELLGLFGSFDGVIIQLEVPLMR
jgi:hypothetical protein